MGRPTGSSEKSGTNSSYNAGFSVSSHPKGYLGMDANGLNRSQNQRKCNKSVTDLSRNYRKQAVAIPEPRYLTASRECGTPIIELCE